MLGLLFKIGLNDFRNGHSDFETIVDGLDEDDKSLPGPSNGQYEITRLGLRVIILT